MALLEQEQAGLIAQAASKYLDNIPSHATRAQLVRVVNLAKAAEQSPTSNPLELQAVRGALCTFCKSEKIFPCRGYQRQNGCAFVETGLALTPSQFGALTATH